MARGHQKSLHAVLQSRSGSANAKVMLSLKLYQLISGPVVGCPAFDVQVANHRVHFALVQIDGSDAFVRGLC